jgi:hypothetical protein
MTYEMALAGKIIAWIAPQLKDHERAIAERKLTLLFQKVFDTDGSRQRITDWINDDLR